jgi:hypothetical protein
MNVRISSLIVIALAGAAACKSNPLADGSGTPTEILASFSSLTLNNGDSTTFTAQVVDNRLTPLPAAITFASCDASVAQIRNDPTFQPVPATSARAIVKAVGLQKVCVVVSSSGLKPDTVQVTSLPVVFPGSFSKTSFGANDTVTVSGTSLFGFAPAAAGLVYPTVVEPLPLPIVSATATSIKFIGGKFDPTKVWRISGVNVNYAGITVSLPTSAGQLSYAGGAFAGDSLPSTAPDISGWLTALPADSTVTSVLMFPQAGNDNHTLCAEGTGPCSYLKFTLAAPTTLTLSANWDGDNGGNPDVDIYVCSASSPTTINLASCADSANGGGAGAASNKPESVGKFTYAAGTYFFVAEYFAACDGNSCPDVAGAVNNLQLRVVKR